LNNLINSYCYNLDFDFDHTLGSNHKLVVDHRNLELLELDHRSLELLELDLHNLELVLGRSRHFDQTLVIVELLHILMVVHKLELVLVVAVEERCMIQLGLQHCFEQLSCR